MSTPVDDRQERKLEEAKKIQAMQEVCVRTVKILKKAVKVAKETEAFVGSLEGCRLALNTVQLQLYFTAEYFRNL